jgi:hypothetical protein
MEIIHDLLVLHYLQLSVIVQSILVDSSADWRILLFCQIWYRNVHVAAFSIHLELLTLGICYSVYFSVLKMLHMHQNYFVIGFYASSSFQILITTERFLMTFLQAVC